MNAWISAHPHILHDTTDLPILVLTLLLVLVLILILNDPSHLVHGTTKYGAAQYVRYIPSYSDGRRNGKETGYKILGRCGYNI